MRNIEMKKLGVRLGMIALTSLSFIACFCLTPGAKAARAPHEAQNEEFFQDPGQQPIKMGEAGEILVNELVNNNALYQSNVVAKRGDPNARPGDSSLDSVLLNNQIQGLIAGIEIATSRVAEIKLKIDEKTQTLQKYSASLEQVSNNLQANQSFLDRSKADHSSNLSYQEKLTATIEELKLSKAELQDDVKDLVKDIRNDFEKYLGKKEELSKKQNTLEGLQLLDALMKTTLNISFAYPSSQQ